MTGNCDGALNRVPDRNDFKKNEMIKVFNPYNSSSTNGCYFCMTLCVAIATAQERKIWFIQEAYLLYIS